MKAAMFFLAMVTMFARMGSCQRADIGVFEVALADPQPLIAIQDKTIIVRVVERAKFPRNFHVRMFRGTPESVIAEAHASKDANGCDILHSAVLPVTARGTLQVPSLDKAWLKNTGASFETQDYTLVFEAGDQPNDREIHLHDQELKAYFQHSVRMQLRSNGTQFPPEVVATVRRKLNEHSPDLVRVTTSVCWSLREVPANELVERTLAEKYLVARLTVSGCSPVPERPIESVEVAASLFPERPSGGITASLPK